MQHLSFDVRTQGRSRALGLEVNEPLPRAFRRLAEIPGTLQKPGSKRVSGCSRRTLAHPLHLVPPRPLVKAASVEISG